MPSLQRLKQFARILLITPATQPFFESLHAFSVRMMNYGNALFENTGEIKAYETVLKHYIKSHSPASAKFVSLDVGGNKGNYAKACLEITEKAQVPYTWFSFEPAPNTFEKCTETIQAFSGAKVLQVALSDRSGTARFRVSNSDYLGTNGLLADNEQVTATSDAREIEVPTMTLTEFAEQNNICQINFLKVDAEGFDLNVLLGAKKLIENKQIDVIQFEYGYSANSHFLKEYFDLLSPYYTFYRILPTGIRLVKKYNLDLEIPHGINYLCFKK